MSQYLVTGHMGLGDQIYMRNAVLELARDNEVWAETCFPELYAETAVKPVAQKSMLRVQAANRDRLSHMFSSPPRGATTLRCHYRLRPGMVSSDGTLPGMIADSLGVPLSLHAWRARAASQAAAADVFQHLQDRAQGRRVGLCRLITERKQYNIQSRNPDPHVFNAIVEGTKDEILWVGVASTSPGMEWLVKPPDIEIRWSREELHWTEVAELSRLVDVTLSPPGFMIPVLSVTGGTAVFVFGGHIRPEVLMHPMSEPLCRMFIAPDKFCACNQLTHNCDKTVSGDPVSLFKEMLSRDPDPQQPSAVARGAGLRLPSD